MDGFPETSPGRPQEMFRECPVRASLGVLGRKWTLLVLRTVAYYPGRTYSRILQANCGLTRRMLSRRLRELQEEGLITRVPSRSGRIGTTYQLTDKGKDVLPVLAGYLHYGMRHHAEIVFGDARPRTLKEVFPGAQEPLFGRVASYVRADPPPGEAPRTTKTRTSRR
jgi:DNA-binding HxlR family transcriptional regulator